MVQKTGANTVLFGFTFNGGGSYSGTSVTLVTFNWKTLVYHANTSFIIQIAGKFPTKLLDNGFNNVSFTTTNGVYTCNLSPIK